TLDVERDLAAQIALHTALQLLGDDVAQPPHLGVVELSGAGVGIDLGQAEDAPRGGRPDAEDVGQRHLDALVARDVNACDTCHSASSALPLLVLGVLTDDANRPAPLDHLAAVAHLLHRRPYLHLLPDPYPSRWMIRPRPGSAAESSIWTRSPGRMRTAW